jgi:hypothetical protein
MRHVLFALAVVGIFATGAMAIDLPATDVTLTVAPSTSWGTLSYSGTGGEYKGRLTAAAATAPYLAAVTTPSGNDYDLWTQVDFENETELGLLARGNVGSLSLYEASINPNNGYAALVRIDFGAGTNLGTFAIPGFSTSKQYGLRLTVSGSDLSAKIYESDWSYLGKISATDSTYTTGAIGLFELQHSGKVCDGTFITPEPGAVSSLIAGAMALLGWAGLRRRRG